jgi:hypothetical protein
MIIEAVVQPSSNISFSDGDDVKVRAGKSAELLVSSVHQELYSQVYSGNLFHGYTTTPAAIPITSTTAPTCILYNPKSSGINCILIEFAMGYVSGTNTEGNVMLGVITAAPAAIATGAAISAFTDGPVINGVLGGGKRSQVRFGSAATVVAATQFYPMGITNLNWLASSDMAFTNIYNFRGQIIVPPGVAVFSCASAATVALYNQRLSWYEFPT